MEIFIALFWGIVGIIALGTILLFPLRRKFVRQLKQKSDKELELMVFRFEDSYFNYLGIDNPDVSKFKTIINSKNLLELKQDWKRLARSFRSLERKVGHRGRPLIMEYYLWHELAIKELYRRNR